jgi:hypothetical protein
MPERTNYQSNFSAGQVSRTLGGRTDLSKYFNSAEIVQNFVVLPQGGVKRRSGTMFVARAKHHDKETRLIPFTYSTTETYVIEAGHLYFRFYKDRKRLENVYDITAGVEVTGFTNPWYAIITIGAHALTADQEFTVAGVNPDSYDKIDAVNQPVITIVTESGGPTITFNTTLKTFTPHSGNPFLHVAAGDTLIVENSAANDGTFTVASVAGSTPVVPTVSEAVTSGTTDTCDIDWKVTRTTAISYELDVDPGAYVRGGTVTAAYEIVSPYSDADLMELKYTQSADILFLTHSDYQPRELQRSGDKNWAVALFAYEDGPYLSARAVVSDSDAPNQSDVTITPADVTGSGITITASANLFTIDDVGRFIRLKTSVTEIEKFFSHSGGTKTRVRSERAHRLRSGDSVDITGTEDYNGTHEIKKYSDRSFIIDVAFVSDQSSAITEVQTINGAGATGGTFTLTFEGQTTGSIAYNVSNADLQTALQLLSTIDNVTIASGPLPAATTVEFVGDLVKERDADTMTVADSTTGGSGVTVLETAPGTAGDAGWSKSGAGVWGWAEIASHVSPTQMTIDIKEDFNSTLATLDWRLGAWGDRPGWPFVAEFHDGRIWFGGRNNQMPQTLWSSVVGDFINFSPSALDDVVADDNAVTFTIDDDEVNTVRWLQSTNKGLILFTDGGEFLARSRSTTEPITPTSIGIFRHGSYGVVGNLAKPQFAGEAILFVERSGLKLRELLFSFDADQFQAKDMTVLVPDLPEGPFHEIAVIDSPHPVVWARTATGQLLGMTYNRLQEVTAWHQHSLGGGLLVNDVVISGYKPGDPLYFELAQDTLIGDGGGGGGDETDNDGIGGGDGGGLGGPGGGGGGPGGGGGRGGDDQAYYQVRRCTDDSLAPLAFIKIQELKDFLTAFMAEGHCYYPAINDPLFWENSLPQRPSGSVVLASPPERTFSRCAVCLPFLGSSDDECGSASSPNLDSHQRVQVTWDMPVSVTSSVKCVCDKIMSGTATLDFLPTPTPSVYSGHTMWGARINSEITATSECAVPISAHPGVPGVSTWRIWAHYMLLIYNCSTGLFTLRIDESFMFVTADQLYSAAAVYSAAPNAHALEVIGPSGFKIDGDSRGASTAEAASGDNTCYIGSPPTMTVAVRLFEEDFI